MKQYHLFLFIFFLIGFLLLEISCNQSTTKTQDLVFRDISEIKVSLPDYEGKELVERNCMICHSLRYLEIQPDMPKKNWEKIVAKMIKNFGAPVHDTLTSNAIVNYLFMYKGTK